MSHSIIRLACYLAVVCGVSLRHIALIFASLFLIPITKSSIKRWIDDIGSNLPSQEEMLQQLLAITPVTECPIDGYYPRGTDHCVMVVKDEHNRILMTHEAGSENSADARKFLRKLTYVMDSLPVAVCDNYRIPRAKLSRQEAYRGYVASKKRYFYGVQIHLMITKEGQPVEMFLTPGSFGDVEAWKGFSLDLPAGATVYDDKAYNDYEIEDLLREVDHIVLRPRRKKNSKRTLPPYVEFVQRYQRKRVETVGRLLEQICSPNRFTP